MEPPDLHRLLLEDARRYDAGVHARGLLVPFRDVILLQRAKYMSYEQISATFGRHGLRVSPAAVGAFCRRTFTKTEIEQVRRSPPAMGGDKQPYTAPAPSAPAFGAAASGPATPAQGKRGPKIARDNY